MGLGRADSGLMSVLFWSLVPEYIYQGGSVVFVMRLEKVSSSCHRRHTTRFQIPHSHGRELHAEPAILWLEGRMVDVLGYRCMCNGYDAFWL